MYRSQANKKKINIKPYIALSLFIILSSLFTLQVHDHKKLGR